eukprot:CAMPEP_0176271782 /NCGR_PEP_ID=MMETSP0121_2-20121125/45379_1 /TAXON_ID=160619 /ORGANISM="Kryptoperidinium foliaceum, Strain CCMP 1326" /LENGTH=84 /DNA_ID=CAMNT_0017611941 /DNA_START=30 /DNA_END=280 /DNA_ORIENTATION=-
MKALVRDPCADNSSPDHHRAARNRNPAARIDVALTAAGARRPSARRGAHLQFWTSARTSPRLSPAAPSKCEGSRQWVGARQQPG